MPYEIIETRKYIMKIHENGFLEYKVREGATLDAYDVIDGKKRILKHYPTGRFYVLMEGIGFFSITKEARAICATEAYADNTIAIAFYTTNFSLWLLAEMYNKLNKPLVPVRAFNKRENACDWLLKQMQGRTRSL